MTRPARLLVPRLLVTLLCLGAVACQLRRPDTTPIRTIEPQMVEPASAPTNTPGAVPVRLLETQRRGHLGRVVLHLQPDGELIEDPAWRWSSEPHRYLDEALRFELASSPDLRLVDTGNVQTLAVTLVAWYLESSGSTRLVGAVELDLTGTDRAVRPQAIRASEAVSAELPGDLAAAAGRLLRRLASEAVARIPRPGRT
jgi:hypothetical protein